jgi:hypothetical protein
MWGDYPRFNPRRIKNAKKETVMSGEQSVAIPQAETAKRIKLANALLPTDFSPSSELAHCLMLSHWPGSIAARSMSSM